MYIVLYEILGCSPCDSGGKIRPEYKGIIVLVKEFVELTGRSGAYLTRIYIKILKARSIDLSLAVIPQYLKEFQLKPEFFLIIVSVCIPDTLWGM